MTRKDAQEYVVGLWIIEVAELVAARRDIETVKAFITRQEDEFRWSHGREVERRPRQCVFIGTTNDEKYLRDETGNRRFWPVRVGKADVAALRRDRNQLRAEAVVLYRQGVQWWLPSAMEASASDEQAKRLDVDPWITDVGAYLDGKEYVTPREVLVHAISKDIKEITRRDSDRVAGILRTLGYDRDPNDAKITSGEFKSYPKYRRRAS